MKEQTNEKIKLCTYLIGIFLLLIPADTFELLPGISFLRVLALLVIISCFLYRNNQSLKLNPIIILLLFYVFYSIIQIFYTDYIPNVITKVSTIFMYTILLVSVSRLNFTNKEKIFLKKCFIFSSWVALLLIILFKADFEGRLTISIFGKKVEDPNQFCGYFIPGTLYYFYSFLSNKNKKIKNLIILILFLYIVFLTGSRGGLLSILGGLFVVTLIYDKNKDILKRSFKICLTSILIYIIFIYLIKFLNSDLALRFSINNILESGGTGRTDIWKFYLNYFNNSNILYKLFGYGLGSLSSIYRVAHNTWIESVLESGVIGTLLLLGIIVCSLKTVVKDNNILFISILVSLLILTLSLSLLSYKLLWGYFIIALVIKNKNESRMV